MSSADRAADDNATPPPGRLSVFRATLILGAGLALAWLSASAAASAVWADVRPGLAVRSIIARGPAFEQSALAVLAQAVQSGEGRQQAPTAMPTSVPARSAQLAKMAFAREPLAADAVVILALAANARGDAPAADALFTDVHRLTRRNALADVWLARRAAQRGDMDPALARLDEVLRSNSTVREPVLQQLTLITRDPRFRKGVTTLLAAQPAWAPDFWRIAPTVPDAVSAVAEIRGDLAGKGIDFEADSDRALALALINSHSFDAADALYRTLTGGRASAGERVRNPRFDHASVLPPIDWVTYSVGDFGSEIVPSSKRMYVAAAINPGGGVAREWISLGPGRYQVKTNLDIAATSGPDDRVLVRLSCIESDATQQFALRQGRDLHQFVVPQGGCGNYWLDVVAVPAEGSPGLDAELSLLSITPASTGR